jgi:virginiamycin B lyase
VIAVREMLMRLGVLMLLSLRAVPAMAEPCVSVGGAPPRISEFVDPTFTFPTGIAVAPDGAVWVASTLADQLIRVEPGSLGSAAVRLPLRSHPVGLAADAQGRIWFAASGMGLLGRFSPGTTRAAEFPPPSLLRQPGALPFVAAVALDPRGQSAWFTVGPDAVVATVPIASDPVRRGTAAREVALSPRRSRPEGLAVDVLGAVWVAEMADDSLTRVASDGTISRLPLPAGSRPRGVAVAPDGAVWATLFGSHRLLRVAPPSGPAQSWPMPSGTRSNPWAIAVDAAGAVWTSEFTANTITCFDPSQARFATWSVPTRAAGVRALAVDGAGGVWFVGSTSGRLGVVGPPPPHGRMSAR